MVCFSPIFNGCDFICVFTVFELFLSKMSDIFRIFNFRDFNDGQLVFLENFIFDKSVTT